MSLRDRNLTFGKNRAYRFGYDIGDKLVGIGAFLAIHDPSSFIDRDRESFSTRLFRELQSAWSDVFSNLATATDPENWDIDQLIEEDPWRGDGSHVLRKKPKIVINFTVTTAGNLTVRWHPVEGFRHFNDYAPAFQRPRNEIMFVRGFATAFNHGREMSWEHTMRAYIAEACIEAAWEVVSLAEKCCEVEVDLRVVLDRDDQGHAVRYRIKDAKEIERERLTPYRDEKVRLEHAYGIPIAKIVSIANAYSAEGFNYPRIAAVLQGRFGMREQGDRKNFRVAVKSLRDLLSTLGEAIPVTVLSEEDKSHTPVAPTQSRASPRTTPTDAKRKTTVSPPQFAPPAYPHGEYRASAEELERLGVATVREFVDHVNEWLRLEGRHPITEADYPINKRLFERLVIRWIKMNPSALTGDRAGR